MLTSNKVGHDFPTGPLDIIQSWVEIEVRDDRGQVVYSSGTRDERNFIEPGSFLFKVEPVDQYGNLIDRHNLWEMVGVRFRRALFPGYSDAVDYLVGCPDVLPLALEPRSVTGSRDRSVGVHDIAATPGITRLHVLAKLNYRKVDQFLLNYMFGASSGLSAPVVEIDRAEAEIEVELPRIASTRARELPVGLVRPVVGRRRRRLYWTAGTLVGASILGGLSVLAFHRSGRSTVYRPGEDHPEITRQLDRGVPADAPRLRLEDVTEAAGLAGFRAFTGARSSQLPEDMGPGAAWGDYDGDGDDDLFLVSAGGPLGRGRSRARALASCTRTAATARSPACRVFPRRAFEGWVRRGAITTATATSISSSPATTRCACFATTRGVSSGTLRSPSGRASGPAPRGATTTTTATSTSTSVATCRYVARPRRRADRDAVRPGRALHAQPGLVRARAQPAVPQPR